MALSIVRKWLVAVVAIAVVLVLALVALVFWYKPHASASEPLEYWKLYLGAFKVILIGFFVGGCGILIPKALSEARYSFARFKESLDAFSRAKTGVDYLSARLCGLSLKEATHLVQYVHVWKHRAQLYPELMEHLRARGEEDLTRDEWADFMYEQLHGVRSCVEDHAASWDTMKPDARLVELKKAREAGIVKWEKEYGRKRPGADRPSPGAADTAKPASHSVA